MASLALVGQVVVVLSAAAVAVRALTSKRRMQLRLRLLGEGWLSVCCLGSSTPASPAAI